ncbi:glyoxalase [Dictyobacter alpinus]|uniref:Glyoxalase n=1 Tax=Dictyobacter alpinus TaxID=2014873 RepID=A0A402BJE6_9CHLR|nr:VOC family protein [Dictyobacter alpinus]GCE31467.1 glyoxalase [Dictyobacter alpinus]
MAIDPIAQQQQNAQNWPLRRVGLRVQNMQRSIDYYQRLGLAIVRDERDQDGNGSVGLGADEHEVLQLRTLAGGRPRPRHTAGLFHFALLVPDEPELGSFLQYVLDSQHNVPLGGASDHLVSQALYLTDPEGNGIEVYVDRPRTEWPIRNGVVAMDTLPLDAPHLLKQAHDFKGFSSGLRLGHMHLNVGDLDRTYNFYQHTLGMQRMIGIEQQAYFLSWDGYHHHLGTNLWAGRNVKQVEPDMYGIDFYEIKRPGMEPATIQDPDGVTVIMLP